MIAAYLVIISRSSWRARTVKGSRPIPENDTFLCFAAAANGLNVLAWMMNHGSYSNDSLALPLRARIGHAQPGRFPREERSLPAAPPPFHFLRLKHGYAVKLHSAADFLALKDGMVQAASALQTDFLSFFCNVFLS